MIYPMVPLVSTSHIHAWGPPFSDSVMSLAWPQNITQEKWCCGGPRSCLTCGLVLLVLPVMQSVHHPFVPGDIIQGPDKDQTWILAFSPGFQENLPFPLIFPLGSMWNHQTNGSLPYIGQHHWYTDGQSFHHICHWYKLFQWVF